MTCRDHRAGDLTAELRNFSTPALRFGCPGLRDSMSASLLGRGSRGSSRHKACAGEAETDASGIVSS